MKKQKKISENRYCLTFLPVWLNDKQLDSLICSCTQSFEITHHVVYGTFYNDELDVTEEVVSLLVL